MKAESVISREMANIPPVDMREGPGKGDRPRRVNLREFARNYDRIFRTKTKAKPTQETSMVL